VLSEELFLPDPAPREVRYTVISVDDHVVEPAHTFEGRLPNALQDRAPRIVETKRGHQVWEFEGDGAVPGQEERYPPDEVIEVCDARDHVVRDADERRGERRRFTRVDIEVREAVKQIAAHARTERIGNGKVD